MEFRQLRYFVKVAELRSFSEASKALFISQSTLSQQVKQLEEELGVDLLVRDSRHVALSDYGEQYLPYAKQVLKDVDASAERMKDVRELSIGTLNVGATYTFCPLLADTVRDYMKRYPGIKLKIFCRSMENLMEMLEHGQLDVALSYKPLESYEDIDSHILFNSKLCVIAGKDNPVARMESIRLTELEKLPLALPARGLQARNLLQKRHEGVPQDAGREQFLHAGHGRHSEPVGNRRQAWAAQMLRQLPRRCFGRCCADASTVAAQMLQQVLHRCFGSCCADVSAVAAQMFRQLLHRCFGRCCADASAGAVQMLRQVLCRCFGRC